MKSMWDLNESFIVLYVTLSDTLIVLDADFPIAKLSPSVLSNNSFDSFDLLIFLVN